MSRRALRPVLPHSPARGKEDTPVANSQQMLKLDQVLAELGMSRAAFYRMRARGRGPRLLKLPNGHLPVRRSDLDAWVSQLDTPAY